MDTTSKNATTNNTRNMVCLWGRSDMGKTPTLLNLIPLFHAYYRTAYKVIWANPNDIGLVIYVNGIKVGINTMGDPGYGLKNRLEKLTINEKCDLIVCSCRTKGITVREVQDVANNGKYNLIWTTNFNANNSQAALNRLSAQNLFELLKTLIP